MNAYNSISRKEILKVLEKEFPELVRWFVFCYGTRGVLMCDGEVLPFGSAAGVQQGDPLGPLLFAAGILRMCRKLGKEAPGCLKLWYLDDGSFAGPGEELKRVWDMVNEEARKVGLRVNVKKCELWGWEGEEEEWMKDFPREVLRVKEKGFELLGAPIGSKEFCEKCATERVGKVQEVLAALKNVDDAQVELALLRSCLGLPRFGFTMRSAPPKDIEKALELFDIAIERTVEERLKIHLDDETRLQWGLPVRMGGFGIPKATDVAAPAYLGNALLALPFVRGLCEERRIGMADMKGVEEARGEGCWRLSRRKVERSQRRRRRRLRSGGWVSQRRRSRNFVRVLSVWRKWCLRTKSPNTFCTV